MAYFFGASMATDAFVTAFRVPNLLRDMFAEGALASAFVPVFKSKLVSETEEDAYHLASVLMSAIIAVVGMIVILGIMGAPAIIYVTANGFVSIPFKFQLTVSLTRIMMVYLLLVSLSAVVMGMLNSYGRFGIPALASAVFNAGMIGSVVVFYQYFEQPIYAMAIGVVIGGLGQLGIQLPSLWKLGFRFKLNFNFLDEGLKRVVRLVTPMIIGLSAGRVNILISTLLASFLVEGSISYLNYSYRLMHFPMGVFAVALGTVALPRVSEMVARSDHEGLARTFHETVGLNLLILIPSAVFLGVGGEKLISLIFQYGSFTGVHAHNTYLALLHYSYGLIGFATVRVVVPFYYAHNDSKTPMRISILAVAVNILLYYPLIKLYSFAGLAAATSIAGLLNCALLIYKLPGMGIPVGFSHLGIRTAKMLAAALGAIYLAELIPSVDLNNGKIAARVLDLFILGLSFSIIYVIFCYVLRITEITSIIRKLFRKRN